MSESAAALRSGKGHTDENFPVASFLIAPRHRAPILAFYRFARTADDVADHPAAPPGEKLALLEGMRASLVGDSAVSEDAVRLKETLGAHGLSPQHALDLLEAFRRDVTKLRYADWDELMDYCRYSASPVGRFVLDVHGEARSLWPANDALCSALQVINHLQDCGKDFRALDRVYVPLEALSRQGIGVEALGGEAASPGLRRAIAELAARTDGLLARARPFARGIADFRLGLEVSVIQRLAESLNAGLARKDPLRDRVHHGKAEMLGLAFLAAMGFVTSRLGHRSPAAPALLEP